VKTRDPKRAQKVRDGELTLGAAIRELKLENAVAAVQSLPPPTSLEGPWGVIVADPPWQYDKRAKDATHRAALPYPSMTLDEIRELKIPLPADDAILWLWTTNAHMEHAFGVAREWGFEPRTILTWVKNKMGTGDWLRGQTEHCLLCTRGHPAVTLTNQTTVINGPMRAHSQKPDEFFVMVEALCPDKRRIELFAREARSGWEAWGEAHDQQ
jgi:N6-adenosine-specific RNA methylase IME4